MRSEPTSSHAQVRSVAGVRVGLVLGAGGIAGGAWHAGVLDALHEATGWDPRQADVVVGTSAGSVTGAGLRAGLPAGDLYALARGTELSPGGAALLARVRTDGAFTRLPTAGRFRRPVNPLLLRSLASLNPRPGIALAGLLPSGALDPTSIAERVDQLHGSPAWPEAALWIVSVRLSDGDRTVFGRDPIDAPLGAAVASSCAIPGWFAPVEIGGRRYVDGGAHSTTNADLLADVGLDLVVVSAPMAAQWRGLRPNPVAVSRTAARVRLDREVASLRRRGVEVLVLQPGPDLTPLMDLRAMDPASQVPVATQARASVLVYLARDRGPRPAP